MVNLITIEDGSGRKVARPIKDSKEYIALRNAPDNAKNFYDARGGDEAAKARQIQFNYNDLLPDGVLKGCCHPSSTFAHDIDCGDANEQQRIKAVLLEKKDEIGLLELSGSARYGIHAVCRREQGKTIRECQYKLSMITRTEYDTNSRGLARVFYTGPATSDNLFYLDEALFEETMTVEESEKEYELLKERESQGLEEVPKGAKKANKHYRPWEEQGDTQGTGTLCSAGFAQMSQSPCVTSVAEADERTRFVFRECMKEEGVEPEDFVIEGRRHNSVKNVLGLCNQLLSKEETLGVLKEMMPKNWQDENIQQLVEAFYTDYYNPSQRLSLVQKRIFKESKALTKELTLLTQGTGTLCSAGFAQMSQSPCELSRMFASNTPPEIPENLPKLVKAVTSKTPKHLKAAVAQAMFPPLGAYPKDLSFVYIDNQIRELRINCLIVAGTGKGKDSCTKEPLTHITADMKQRDMVNRDRLKKFNEEYNNKANNKQKPQRPDDLVIQIIKANITYAALVQRMDEAQRAPLYVRLNELEQWDKVEGCSGRNNQFTNLKLCDDEGNDFGADRASTQSVMGSGSLHLNWNANTTVAKAHRYFRYVVSDGPISRLCLATIPDGEIGGEIPVYGDYDEAYDEALKPFIDNLKAATGKIDCQPAKKLAKKLKAECAEFARLSQDEVFDNLTHRALVHAFRKACLLYAANGMKWEKAIEEFCRWSLYYDLYLKMKLWGDQIRQADGDIMVSKRGPQSLLDLLPSTFTLEDAKRVRQQQGIGVEKTMGMIRNWMNRKYVIQYSEFSFEKTGKTVMKK